MSLSTGAIENALSALSYKPGWSFTITLGDGPHGDGEFRLRIAYEAPDSNGHVPGLITIVNETPLPPLDDLGEFVNFLKTCIHSAEFHESTEWLKLRGERLREPHPDLVRHRSRDVKRALSTFLGTKLRAAREARGLVLRRIEIITGVSNVTVSQIETGHIANPGFFTVARLAFLYGIDLEVLAREALAEEAPKVVP